MRNQRNDRDRVPVTIRIPEVILKEIDVCVGSEELPVSRNHWIVEALVEKLKKTKNGSGTNGAQ